MKIIPYWRVIWRSWSVRLNAIGLAILGWFAIDPVSLLYVWSMMPPAVHDLIPSQWLSLVGAALFALSLLARMVKQPKMEAKINAETD